MSDDKNPEIPHPDEGKTSEYPTMVYPPAETEAETGAETGADGPGAETATLGIGANPDVDPDADAEWVVQTTRGVRLGLPVAGLLAVLLVGAGFWGGAAVEKSHGGSSAGASLASLASRFRSARTGATSTTSGSGGTTGAGTGATGFGGFAGFGSSAAATGTISVVAGNTLYVLTSTGSLVKVTLTPSTTMSRDADAAAADLRPGDAVVVQGSTSANGNVSATSIAATAPGISSTGGRGFGGAGAGGAGAGGATSTTAAG